MKSPTITSLTAAAARTSGPLESIPMFYGGRWREASDGAAFETSRPATGLPWARLAEAGPTDVAAAVDAARQAFDGPWRATLATDRARALWEIGSRIDRHLDELAVIESTDNGKALRETRAELGLVVRTFEFFAGVAQSSYGATFPRAGSSFTYTTREPVGVVGAIIPWNSPLVLLSWKVCPALAAGNTIVIKTAEDTPVSALALASLLEDVLPAGVFNVVSGFGPRAGRALVSSAGIDKVAFTGSTETGREIAALAAASVKPITLELGGKSPSVVFPDADLDSAITRLAYGIFSAGGQSCMAASRILVHSKLAAEFTERLAAKADSIRVGDPLDQATHVGAQTSARQLAKIEEYVALGVDEGVTLAAGGRRPEGLEGGYFFRPTVLARAQNTMRVAREEIFGPVVSLLEFDDEEEALAIANDSPFGLAGSVWTTDVKRAHRVADQLDVGTVWINNYRLWNWLTPFGGTKDSGYGRENGLQAMEHYTRVKSVWVELADQHEDWFA